MVAVRHRNIVVRYILERGVVTTTVTNSDLRGMHMRACRTVGQQIRTRTTVVSFSPLHTVLYVAFSPQVCPQAQHQ
jgi:hypothetical protein